MRFIHDRKKSMQKTAHCAGQEIACVRRVGTGNLVRDLSDHGKHRRLCRPAGSSERFNEILVLTVIILPMDL